MALDKELLALDANKVVAVADKVLAQIKTETESFLHVPDEYVALNALITRVNQMSAEVDKRIGLGIHDIDDETLGFLRGITAGVWIAAAVLRDYAQTTEFEAKFDKLSSEPNDK